MSFVAGKIALVTGGASGIGLAVVQKLLEDGVKGVGLVDISEENGIKAVKDFQKSFNDKVVFIKADITVQIEFEDAFKETICKFKHLDIVINNAGIANELQWEKCIAVNLVSVMRGTFLSMEKYLLKFKTSDEAVIVNVASVLGIAVLEDFPTYCATKHGVVGLGRSLGTENIWKKNKVRIITICPGPTDTPLYNSSFPKIDSKEEEFQIEKASSPAYVGNAVVNLINEGKHGSVWVVKNGKSPYEVTFPESEIHKI